MATTAQFVAAPVIDIAQVTTANANRDGTGTTVLVCSGPTFAAGTGVGKRITRGIIQGVTANTAGVIRFFLSNDGGSNKSLYVEKAVPAYTFSGTSPGIRTDVPELVGLVLPGVSGANASQLYASTQTSHTFNIIIESGTL
jgi:hypothetical protein